MMKLPSAQQKKMLFAAVVAVVVVVVAGFFLLRKQPGSTGPAPIQPPPQYVPVVAPKGEVIAGFPKELILDDKAMVAGSYAINYNEKLNQYTATFTSSQKMLALYDSYLAYFSKNGWTVTNKNTKYPISRGIYAKKDANTASVAIVDEVKSRQVTVSYLVK